MNFLDYWVVVCGFYEYGWDCGLREVWFWLNCLIVAFVSFTCVGFDFVAFLVFVKVCWLVFLCRLILYVTFDFVYDVGF